MKAGCSPWQRISCSTAASRSPSSLRITSPMGRPVRQSRDFDSECPGTRCSRRCPCSLACRGLIAGGQHHRLGDRPIVPRDKVSLRGWFLEAHDGDGRGRDQRWSDLRCAGRGRGTRARPRSRDTRQQGSIDLPRTWRRGPIHRLVHPGKGTVRVTNCCAWPIWTKHSRRRPRQRRFAS